jgi:hypothetical protein
MLFALAILGVYALASAPLLRLALRAARAWLDTRGRSGATLPALTLPALRSAARHDALLTAGNARETPTLPRHAVLTTTAAGSADRADAQPDPQQVARLWLRGILILAALGTLAEYALSRRTVGPDQFVVVRYLLPLYITLPVLIGPLWEMLTSAWLRLRTLTPSQAGLKVGLAGAALGLLLGLFIYSGAEAVFTATDTSRFALPATHDQHVMAKLQSLSITAYYGAYWICYNLVFESGERLHCSSYLRVERYPPYAVYLSQVEHPAYLLPAGSATDQAFQHSQAVTLYHAGYRRLVVDDVAIYYLPAPTR